ncbi:hypothetical protein scyTo_0016058 [Scyliorhinus torazame]|uniref:TFIIS N-terminal domain-containing protein n=1 Tax=Scyliorhinus torazame TaxID=75743 RepID=A0A401Q3H1_SCYTO|nr:hypothetical protein [Scyliorhinus torazame]
MKIRKLKTIAKVKKVALNCIATLEPKKLESHGIKVLKLLKQLQELRITVDILVETGIGKTVNGFRKNGVVGRLAKELVCRWKKLIPEETSRNISEQNERMRNNDFGHFGKKENTDKSSGLSSHEETLHMTDVNKPAKLNEGESPQKREGAMSNQQPSKINSNRLKTGKQKPSWGERKKYSNCASKNISLHDEQLPKNVQKSDKSKSSDKDQNDFSGKAEKPTSGLKVKKSNKNQHKKDSSLENPATSSVMSQENCLLEKGTGENGKKNKRKSMDETENLKLSSKVQKWSSKDKESCGADKLQDMSCMAKESIKACKVEGDSEFEKEEFEKPTMTFESYLNYEEPKRKAKRIHTNKNLTIPGKHKDSKLSTIKKENAGSHSKESNRRKNTDRRPQHEEDIWLATPKKGKIDINTLLDIPLPKFLPDVTDMPSDSPPASPVKKSTPNVPDSTVEFTGRRLNCKMQVYSGSKTTNILKMMSLYEQCIRVLQNNIDSIHEVGGVPFEIIEPVLERCTSEQLCRIEECNPYDPYQAPPHNVTSRQVKLAYLSTSAKPPRDILRQQGKHGTAGSALQSSPFAKHKKTSSLAGGNVSSDRTKGTSGYVAVSSHSGPEPKKQVKSK